MIESPAPDTDLEIDSLDVLGENPSAWRKCGEINGETRPKVDVWITYVLDLDLSSHINLLHSRSNTILRLQQADYRRFVVVSFSLSGKKCHVEGRVVVLNEGAFVRIRQQCAGVISIFWSGSSSLALCWFSQRTHWSSPLNMASEWGDRSSDLRCLLAAQGLATSERWTHLWPCTGSPSDSMR